MRSGPPSCVNQAIQTVMIVTIMLMMNLMKITMFRVQWETGLVEVWVEERKTVPLVRSP